MTTIEIPTQTTHESEFWRTVTHKVADMAASCVGFVVERLRDPAAQPLGVDDGVPTFDFERTTEAERHTWFDENWSEVPFGD